MTQQDWLWDRKITIKQAKGILKNPQDKHFLSLSSLLFSRKNTPKEIFSSYLRPVDFLSNWHKIKRQMRKDAWNDPRIEFWQAIYEKIKEKYRRQGINIPKEPQNTSQKDEFCKLIADKMKAMRKQKGLTQKELAQKLNISQQLISRIESGWENVSLLTLKRITDSLGAQLSLEIS